MKGFRTTVVLLVAAAALSLAVTLAVAAPSALMPSRDATAGVYCPPGELDARQDAVQRAKQRLAKAKAQLARLKARKAGPVLVSQKAKSVAARQKQLRRAQAKLDRCD